MERKKMQYKRADVEKLLDFEPSLEEVMQLLQIWAVKFPWVRP